MYALIISIYFQEAALPPIKKHGKQLCTQCIVWIVAEAEVHLDFLKKKILLRARNSKQQDIVGPWFYKEYCQEDIFYQIENLLVRGRLLQEE